MRTLEDWWSEISPLLDEAMELRGSARDAWLARGNAEEARELAAEALSQFTPTVGPDHPLLIKAARLAE